jgi:hypothetical protein
VKVGRQLRKAVYIHTTQPVGPTSGATSGCGFPGLIAFVALGRRDFTNFLNQLLVV